MKKFLRTSKTFDGGKNTFAAKMEQNAPKKFWAKRFKVFARLLQKAAGCRGGALTKKTLRSCFTASK
ncbi:MAG: hypothetical protein IJY89_02605 [Clostridia bacterium]|nr:hypothetical protein [Clostridia bacterium]